MEALFWKGRRRPDRRCYIVRVAHADSPQIGACLRMVLESLTKRSALLVSARGDHCNIRHHAMPGVANVTNQSNTNSVC